MKTKIASETLLEIRQIKEISSIKYKDLLLSTPSEKQVLEPGFIITYGPVGKYMYLTAMDPYFDEFVKKIRDVYLEEKDHVIRDGILGKEHIQIDPLTEQMLLNSNIEECDASYQEYAKQESYLESLLMEEDKVKALFPVVSYHLKEFLKKFNKVLINIHLSKGNNGIYHLKGQLDGIPTIIPMYIEWKDDSWNVMFGSILEKSIPIQMTGSISEKGLLINCRIEEYEYVDETTYGVKKDAIKKERTITYQGKRIYYENNPLPKDNGQTSSEIYQIDGNPEGITWYQLPWKTTMGLYEDKTYYNSEGEQTEEEQPERIVTNKIIYLSKNQKNLFIKEIASRRYHKKIDDRTDGGNIQLDYMNKRRIGVLDGKRAVIETYFTGRGVTGKYKETIAGHYFYQVYPELKKESGFFIGREEGLEEKSDLFDTNKYLVKKEEN